MPINRILTDKDRGLYKSLIEEMFRVIPEMMSRKIPEANVQQAFVLSQILQLTADNEHKNVLSVGCFEDTAYEYLMNIPYRNLNLFGIDPAINYSLKDYATLLNYQPTFDIIFATSVIEHVKDDEQFLDDMCKLLNPGGYGILTTDFKDDYRAGDPLPYTDERFYTKQDLEFRVTPVIVRNGCDLVDVPDWTSKDNFIYQGHKYSFATLVFRKNYV